MRMHATEDLDRLVGTDSAFLLGPWIQAARAWGDNATDCGAKFASCGDFYEWNARTQVLHAVRGVSNMLHRWCFLLHLFLLKV